VSIKERPILFSAPMVRALLADRKTVTRRVAKSDACPYGQPGDRLWVKETFSAHVQTNIEYDEWEEIEGSLVRPEDGYEARARFNYCADNDGAMPDRWRPSIHMPRWASRITLEITAVELQRLHDMSETDAIDEGILSVTDHDPGFLYQHFPEYCAERDLWQQVVGDRGKGPLGPSPLARFKALWGTINGPESWDANPMVWAVSFRRVQP
jgi:hypothetical protein